MGRNYHNDISDVLTNGFDVLYKEWKANTKLRGAVLKKRERVIRDIVAQHRSVADNAFRTSYSSCKRLLNKL